MASGFGAVGLAGVGVAAIAVENVQNGHDPVPSLLSGSVVMLGASILSQWQPSLGLAFAAVFALGAILTHSTLFGKAVNGLSTAATSGGSSTRK